MYYECPNSKGNERTKEKFAVSRGYRKAVGKLKPRGKAPRMVKAVARRLFRRRANMSVRSGKEETFSSVLTARAL